MYHSVSRPGEPDLRPEGYWLTPGGVAAQFAALREAGARSVSLEELLSWSREGNSLPGKAFSLTFDDGYRNNFTEAAPLLAAHGFKATFFVTAGTIGEPHMLKNAEIRQLRELGMEVGSHGLTHELYRGRSREWLRHELALSRRILEDALGEAVRFFSLPRGYLPPGFPELVREAGYLGMCTSIPGRNTRETSPFLWLRFPIRKGDGPETAVSILSGKGPRYRGRLLREKVLAVARIRHRIL